MGWLQDFFSPSAGAQNSALLRVNPSSAVQGYVPTVSTDNTPDLQPDTMTDADKAYWASMHTANQAAADSASRFFSMQPDPGAINQAQARANPNLPATAFAAPGMLAPYGYGGGGVQQVAPPVTPAAASSAPPTAAPPVASTAPAPTATANVPDTTIAPATGPADVTVPDNTDTSQPAPATPADGSGGLLGHLTAAAQDPDASKGLLSSFGDSLKGMADKLTNLSPQASQGLIASGLTMLANNSGGKNLSQLVGEGGIAGVNTYQNLVQTKVANELAQQKLQQEWQEKQQNMAIEANRPTGVKPGESYVTPAMTMKGIPPQQVGGQAVAKEVSYIDDQGVEHAKGVDWAGKDVPGTDRVTKNPYVGPADTEGQKTINAAVEKQNGSAQSLQRIQGLVSNLSDTMVDPKTGQTVPNPDYKGSPVGGIFGSAQNAWTHLTGSMTDSQVLRQQIINTVNQANLGSYKSQIGGRLSNADIGMMQRGLPSETAGGPALKQYLAAYGHLIEDQATRDALTSRYLQANQGREGPLHSDSVIAGHMYPKGTELNDIIYGDAKGNPVYTDQPAGGGNQPATAAPPTASATPQPAIVSAAVAEARRRGLKGY
jgi:hypothetical protein